MTRLLPLLVFAIVPVACGGSTSSSTSMSSTTPTSGASSSSTPTTSSAAARSSVASDGDDVSAPDVATEAAARSAVTEAPPVTEDELVADSDLFRGAFTMERVRRFRIQPSNADRTRRVDLGEGWTAIVFMTSEECADGDVSEAWNLGFEHGGTRWLADEFAVHVTDCAGMEKGPTEFSLAPRDVIAGGPLELIATASVAGSDYAQPDGAAEVCGTVNQPSERDWICGVEGDHPVCWASIETNHVAARLVECASDTTDARVERTEWHRTWRIDASAEPTLIVGGNPDEARFPLRTLACGRPALRAQFACTR